MLPILLVALLVLTPSWVLAQNTENPFAPYATDSATTLLFHFDEQVEGIEPNDGPAGLFGNILGGRWVPDGRFGGALALDGDASIETARSLLYASDELTMEAWVYQTARPDVVFLLDTTQITPANKFGRLLGIGIRGEPFAFAYRSGQSPRVARAPDPIPLNRWVHIAGLWSASRGLVEIAVNGVVMDRDLLGQAEVGSNEITIGRAQSFPDAMGFIGKIDEVRVSAQRRALQPVAVESHSWGAIKSLY